MTQNMSTDMFCFKESTNRSHPMQQITCQEQLQQVVVFLWSIALPSMLQHTPQHTMGWLRLVGSFKLQVSFAEYIFFYRALLQKRPVILRSLLIEATPYNRLPVKIMLHQVAVFLWSIALYSMLQHPPQYTTLDHMSRTCCSRLQCFSWSVSLDSMLQHAPQYTTTDYLSRTCCSRLQYFLQKNPIKETIFRKRDLEF